MLRMVPVAARIGSGRLQAVNIELINTGSELMRGRVLNTHQQWLCRRLSDAGYEVARQVAVSDTALEIQEAVKEALARADLILVTGGLGPTSDDLTRDCIAALLRKPLHIDPTVMAALERFYQERNRPLLDGIKVQAQVPEGGLVLPNHHGTAPGLVLDAAVNPFRPDGSASLLVMLPGPPRELYPMFDEQVLPLLRGRFPLSEPYLGCTLKTTGQGESMIEAQIAGPLRPLVNRGLTVGYCARVGEVEVRLEARGQSALTLISEAERIVRYHLGALVFGVGEDSLESILIQELTRRGQTLALAESCTGGWVAHRLTNVPGASAVLLAGLVTYSNQAKERFLGVAPQIIESEGAVSAPTARAMAEGVREGMRADYGIAITGIAGPAGGTAEKPVGTVYIALASARGTVVQHQINRFERISFKQATAQQALDLLRTALADHPMS